MYIFFLCPRQGPKIVGVVLHRVGIFGFFCPKQGQGLRPSVEQLYPNIGREHPPPRAYLFLMMSKKADIVFLNVKGWKAEYLYFDILLSKQEEGENTREIKREENIRRLEPRQLSLSLLIIVVY